MERPWICCNLQMPPLGCRVIIWVKSKDEPMFARFSIPDEKHALKCWDCDDGMWRPSAIVDYWMEVPGAPA